nr:hypothetical protein Iba_chr05eCG6600 [Ipomoea batatas]
MQKGKKLSKFTSGKKMSKGSRAKKDAAVFCNPEMEKQANAEPKRISLSRSDDEPCVVVESPLPLIYYIFHLETMKDIGWIAKCSIIARKKSDLAMKDEVEEGGNIELQHGRLEISNGWYISQSLRMIDSRVCLLFLRIQYLVSEDLGSLEPRKAFWAIDHSSNIAYYPNTVAEDAKSFPLMLEIFSIHTLRREHNNGTIAKLGKTSKWLWLSS